MGSSVEFRNNTSVEFLRWSEVFTRKASLSVFQSPHGAELKKKITLTVDRRSEKNKSYRKLGTFRYR